MMTKEKSPAIFIGHGSPMSAMPDDSFGKKWREFGKTLKKPKAILVISAHWNIEVTAVSDLKNPNQINDFYGFPQELYALKYEAKGSVELANDVRKILAPIVSVEINNEWGIDHGAWIPLASIFPEADVPVVQLSLDHFKSAQQHYDIAKALKPLREQGVMIIGSGDIVHNLREIDFNEKAQPFAWAEDFEKKVLAAIEKRDHQSLINFDELGEFAKLAIPTPEHFLPLLYVLALQEDDDKLEYFIQGIAHGSISMTSFVLR
jgi:4,5-DOPA dioxygenase extradiol